MDQFVSRYRNLTEIGKVDAPYPDYSRMQRMMEESCATIAWVEQLGITFEKSFTKEMVGTDTVKPDVSADPATEAASSWRTRSRPNSSAWACGRCCPPRRKS